MNPLYIFAGLAALFVLGKKSSANGTPPSSRTPASGFPTGQPMPVVLAPPGSTGNQIGVALAQNSGQIATAASAAAVSIFDWARASADAASTGDAAAAASAGVATYEGDEDVGFSEDPAVDVAA